MEQQNTLEDVLAKRGRTLEEVLPSLFVAGVDAPEDLLRKILVHQALARTPEAIKKPKGIKVNTREVMNRYGGGVEVIREEESRKRCPLSQAAIADEWVGMCGHSYERSFVVEYLKRRGAKCTVFGCNATLSEKN